MNLPKLRRDRTSERDLTTASLGVVRSVSRWQCAQASTMALPCPVLLRPDRGTEESGEAGEAGGRLLSRSNPKFVAGLSESELSRTSDTAIGRDQYGWPESQAPATTTTQVTSLRPAVDGGRWFGVADPGYS